MKLYKPTWINHEGHPIFSIDIHPDDTRFATGGQGDDSTGRVVIWNMKAVLGESTDSSVPRLFCQLDHHSACVNCVRWSNSGQYLASGGDDKVIIIWKLVSKYSGNVNSSSSAFGKTNLEHWKTVSILRNHEGDVLDLSWSPGDAFLASASIDNTVIVWDAQNFPQIITTLRGHSSMVKGVTWDPVGKYIATQSEDKTLRIWRTSDWRMEHTVKEPFMECGGTTHVLRLGWSPDGLYLVSAHAMNCGGPTAQIIERDGWKTDKDFVGHRKAVVCVRFNKNIQEKNRVKQCCVALGSRDRSISIWSTGLKRPVVVVKDAFTNSVMDLAWSHCGTIMMACSWDGSVIATQFSSKELGRSLSQEETVSLYHRFYGNSVVSKNSPNVIPNMEVFLARQILNANKDKEAEKTKVPEIISPIADRKPEEHFKNPENLTKGPDKQIETRTADGKRRITPKFLPLPEVDPTSLTTPLRDESTVFQKQLKDASSTQSQEGNLRERMVSSIDDVSFGENQAKGVIVDGISKVNCVPTTNSNGSSRETKLLDSEKAKEGSAVVNGVQSAEDSSSDKKSEGNSNKVSSVAIAMSPQETNDHLSSKTPPPLPSITAKSLTNGFSKAEKESESSLGLVTPSESPAFDGSLKSKSNCAANMATLIAVKRKRRDSEDMKPPPFAAKKGKLSMPTIVPSPSPKNSIDPVDRNVASEASTITHVRNSVTTKSGIIPKSRLIPMKLDAVSSLQVNIKPESGYSLEVKNRHKRPDGICHQLRCKHHPSSVQGLDWTICTDYPICGISGDLHRIVALCEDATLHVLDLKGRYALSPILLSSYPSKMVQSGPYLLIITTKAYLHLWNIHSKTVVIKSESLLPLLNQPGSELGEKAVDVAHTYLAAGGIPIVYLSNGKSFMFNSDMGSWMLCSDSNGLVSSPLMSEAGDMVFLASMSQMGVRRRKTEPAIISHIKLQLIKATEMKKADSIKQWILVLAKTLATHGLEKELHVLCEDLLGPIHSSLSSSWNASIAGCVDKRSLLRNILIGLVEDLRWQDLFCEFDELLKEVDDSTASQMQIG